VLAITTAFFLRQEISAAETQQFVVIFNSRSGSTWLLSMLRGHPQLYAAEELLWHRPTDVEPVLRQWEHQMKEIPNVEAIGYKVGPSQIMNKSSFLASLHMRKEKTKVIALHRLNRVKAAISICRARSDALRRCNAPNWHLRLSEGANCTKVPASHINTVDLMEELKQREIEDAVLVNLLSSISETGVPIKHITYELLLLGNTTAVVFSILRFLGLSVEKWKIPPPELLKVTSDNIRESVSNFEEVSAVIRKYDPTYERMLQQSQQQQDFLYLPNIGRLPHWWS